MTHVENTSLGGGFSFAFVPLYIQSYFPSSMGVSTCDGPVISIS